LQIARELKKCFKDATNESAEQIFSTFLTFFSKINDHRCENNTETSARLFTRTRARQRAGKLGRFSSKTIRTGVAKEVGLIIRSDVPCCVSELL
jgi:hypothetical protein